MYFVVFIFNAFIFASAERLLSESNVEPSSNVLDGMKKIQQWGDFKRFLVPQQSNALLRSSDVRQENEGKTVPSSENTVENLKLNTASRFGQKAESKKSENEFISSKSVGKFRKKFDFAGEEKVQIESDSTSKGKSEEIFRSLHVENSPPKFVKVDSRIESKSSSSGKTDSVAHRSNFEEKKMSNKTILQKIIEVQSMPIPNLNQMPAESRLKSSTMGIESSKPQRNIVHVTYSNKSEEDMKDAKIVGTPSKQAEGKGAKDKGDDSDVSYLWAIVGPAVGFIIILSIIAIVIAAANSPKSDNKKGSYDVNAVKTQPGELEKYTDYNGPSSFSETISLPSQTDGSVSQGEDSFDDGNYAQNAQPKTSAKKANTVDDADALGEISFQ